MIVPNIRKIITGAKSHPRIQSAFTEIEKFLRHLTKSEERTVNKIVNFENRMYEQYWKKIEDLKKRIQACEKELNK